LLKKYWWLEFTLALALVVLFRISYLLGEHVAFDGDEAVIGIMAQHMFTGEGYPFYFAGQQYGFSLIEVISAAIFLPFFGSTVWTLKAGGILLYSLAVFVVARISNHKVVSPYVYILAIVFIAAFPTWLIWGTKLRGGYQTAFLCLFVLIYLHFTLKEWSIKIWYVAVMLCAIIAVSQVFFLLPILFVLMWRFNFDTTKVQKLWIFGASALFVVALKLPALLNENLWQGPSIRGFNSVGLNKYFIDGFLPHFASSFAYTDVYPLQRGKFILLLILIAFAGSLVFGLLKANRQQRIEFALLFTGALMAIGPILFISLPSGRYLLPFYTSFIVLFLWLIFRINHTLIHKSLLGIVVVTTVVYAFSKKDITSHWLEPQLNDTRALNEMINAIEANGIQHVYCSDWELNWQINYLGNGKINSRFLGRPDRFNDFSASVDSCLTQTNCKTALAGTLWPLHNMELDPAWAESITKINARYYIYPNFETRFLDIAGFERAN
jgi:hypothetical protein